MKQILKEKEKVRLVADHVYIFKIKVKQTKFFYATFVYGHPERTKRQAVWNQLTDQASGRDSPWFLTGDFNEIIDNSEKSGGARRTEESFVDFRSFMSENDLYDMQHLGNALSWRGARHTHHVRCRLDRAMANSAWIECFPSERSEYLRFEGSDHRPLLTCFSPGKRRPKGLFRYDRSLRNNEEVKNLIAETWSSHPRASVEQRIAKCRRVIIQWNREHHINSQEKIEEKRTALEKAMVDPANNDSLILQINTELKEAYQVEEEFWRQRSRKMWLSLGDKNNGYFHAATRGRRARNNISVIEDGEGKSVYEEEQITEVITDYFQKLFTSQEGDRAETVFNAIQPRISPETNEKLIRPPSAEEIKTAIFSIHPDKAPGPDGFSASFFHTNWEAIGPEIIQEIQNFFSSGTLPRSINATHICLIPKIKTPKSVADYRPIALCNVYYKIISKVLTSRLHPILDEIVAENQSAFVPEKAISENVLITHEVLHFLKTSDAKKRGSMAVKTDMSKAYDKIEWEFIRLVLERMGIHPCWIKWVMQCVTTVTFSILINGAARGAIIPYRGIRQGDPLSPYLFILCSEVLSGLCKKA